MAGVGNTETSQSVRETVLELVPLFESTMTFSVSLTIVENMVEQNRASPIILAVCTTAVTICAIWLRIKLNMISLPCQETAKINLNAAVAFEQQTRGTSEQKAAQNMLTQAELAAIIAPLVGLLAWAANKFVRILIQFESVLISAALGRALQSNAPTSFLVIFALFGLSISYGVSTAVKQLR